MYANITADSNIYNFERTLFGLLIRCSKYYAKGLKIESPGLMITALPSKYCGNKETEILHPKNKKCMIFCISGRKSCIL
jgi:hypothetical protein